MFKRSSMLRVARLLCGTPRGCSAALVVSALVLAGCSASGTADRVKAQRDDVERKSGAIKQQTTSLPDQATSRLRGSAESAEALAVEQRAMPVLRRSAKPWIGATMVPVTSEDKLPSVFGEAFVLDFTDLGTGGGVSLQVVAARLSRLSGVPVRLAADVFSSSRAGGAAGMPGPSPGPAPVRVTPGSAIGTAAMPIPMNAVPLNSAPQAQSSVPSAPAGAPPMARPAGASGSIASRPAQGAVEPLSQVEPMTLSNIEMRWSGTLAGYLNMLTDTLGLAWEYRDNTVVISRFVQETHEIVAFHGATRYQMSTAGTGSASGGAGGASNAASASMEVSEAGESDPMTSIEKTIREMLADAPGSAVSRTDGSGRLMVKAPREKQALVRDYVRGENAALRRQATLQFDLYSITTDENDQRGVNWSLILKKAGESATTSFGVVGGLSSAQVATTVVSILPNVQDNKLSELLGNSSVFLQMLNQQGFNAQHRPVSMLMLNRQWGRISRNSTEYYLSETTPGPASTTGVGAPGLKTDRITTGDQILAMTHIMDDNTILLKFGISLSDLLGLFDVSVGQGNLQQKVQAPKISAVNAQFPVAVKPGEVVVVTGLSRTIATSDNTRLAEGAPLAAGGARKSQFKREHFIVFIRPTLM